MIICPNCHHNELPGALFCTQCGALLVEADGIATKSVKTTAGQLVLGKPSTRPLPVIELRAPVSLRVVDSGQILQPENQEELTIGRCAEGQPVSPDIDLTPYLALEMGVSRLHAMIRLEAKQVVVIDLGSANGTRLNGQKIPPHKPCVLHHGDILILGKLKLQVLLRRKAKDV